jgi:hypothetical protein
MNILNTAVKYGFNVNEDIISNNMIQFTLAINELTCEYDSNSNGFAILDLDNIKTPQEGVVYCIIKSLTDMYNIVLNDYNIIVRNSTVYVKEYDLCSGYGEYHDINKSDGSIENDCSELQIEIYYNDTEDIMGISTDLTKDIEENYPKINEITFFRPRKLSALMNYHLAELYMVENENKAMNEIRPGVLHKTAINFISKSRGKLNYPKLSEVITDEQQLYDKYANNCKLFESNIELFVNNIANNTLEDIELIGNVIENQRQSSSDNSYISNILETHNSSFEKLYKSLFPGSYDNEESRIDEEGYKAERDDDNEMSHKCVGQYKLSQNTKNILNDMHNYMKINNYDIITITK